MQELNIFGRVEGLIRIAVKDKIGVLIVAEACPPKLDHRLSSDSTDRTISLDAPLDKNSTLASSPIHVSSTARVLANDEGTLCENKQRVGKRGVRAKMQGWWRERRIEAHQGVANVSNVAANSCRRSRIPAPQVEDEDIGHIWPAFAKNLVMLD